MVNISPESFEVRVISLPNVDEDFVKSGGGKPLWDIYCFVVLVNNAALWLISLMFLMFAECNSQSHHSPKANPTHLSASHICLCTICTSVPESVWLYFYLNFTSKY